jgi:hypothetical protein
MRSIKRIGVINLEKIQQSQKYFEKLLNKYRKQKEISLLGKIEKQLKNYLKASFKYQETII